VEAKLVITIPLELNNVEETDFEVFVEETGKASGMVVQVGHPIEDSPCYNAFELSLEHFQVHLFKDDKLVSTGKSPGKSRA
jgi:hypothetical protein